MSTDILGKVGQLTGTEFKNLRVSIGQTYATKVSLGNVVNTIDFTPYATKVSLGQTNSSVASNASGISALDTSKASKVSLNAYKTGASIFDLLKATRAEFGELKVTGKTTIVDTQTVEVSDNIIELNLASDGGETAQTSGIEINRGSQSTSNANNYDNSTNWSFKGKTMGGYSSDEIPRTIDTIGNSNNSFNGSALWFSYHISDFDGLGNTLRLLFRADNNIELKVDDGGSSTLTSQVIGTWSSTGLVMASGWSISNMQITLNSSYESSGGQNLLGNLVVDFDLTYTESSTTEDKAKILWNDTTSKFELKVGTASADLDTKKIYYSNVFTQESDLPSASTYHGMFAHVHNTGKAYFSHSGTWHELISETGGQTINGNLTLTGDLAVSAGTNIKVNNVELGDFSSFSNAFSNALT